MFNFDSNSDFSIEIELHTVVAWISLLYIAIGFVIVDWYFMFLLNFSCQMALYVLLFSGFDLLASFKYMFLKFYFLIASCGFCNFFPYGPEMNMGILI